MEITGDEIGSDNPVYFIAEAGVNHNGSLEMAKELIDVAVTAGADAVKFQTFSVDRLVTESAPKADYQKERTGEGNQYEMLKQLELDEDDHVELQSYCSNRNITFLSTPFDKGSVDILAALDVPAIKVGSGELNNHPLLRHIANVDRPTILSTGMGTMEEVRAAFETIRSVNKTVPLAFLHCTSAYPTPMDEVNLRAMQAMDEEFPVPVGHSDHTTAVETPGLAVAAGAAIVEKHFTLDKSLAGPDHEASLEPDELAASVGLVRKATEARGSREKSPTPEESSTINVARKSLHTDSRFEPGDRFTKENMQITRPADGLPPTEYERVLGKTATRSLEEGESITDEDISTRPSE